uniref:R3H domain-containing protein n=1 Tax=Setaria digitata TaxID=48799 RepID=A0A915PH42_9BILA
MQKDKSRAFSTVTNNNPNGTQATTRFHVTQNSRRFSRSGRGRSTHPEYRNQPVFFGPLAEFSTPPPVIFDIPPRVLPFHMFNANVVPPIPPLSLNGSGAICPSSSSAPTGRLARGRRTHLHKTEQSSKKSQHVCQESPSEQLSLLTLDDLDDSMADAQEGYGCPPSYVMESYRGQTELSATHGCETFRNNLDTETSIFVDRALQNNREITYREHDSLQTLRENLGVNSVQDEENSSFLDLVCKNFNEWIWTCKRCYHMFHINRANSYGCITQWAVKSFEANVGWRCPSCQNVTFELPKQYWCFCGKKLNPPTLRFPDMPHSCGATCGKIRGLGCTHPCTDQCHPGPCSECPLTITEKCNCGQEIVAGRCGKQLDFKCSKMCGKVLNCGLHKCEIICHRGECNACKHVIAQRCFCGLQERLVPCTALNLKATSFSCGAPCTGMYACDIHKCELRCHDKHGKSDCGLCSLSPKKREYCPCGRTRIADILEVVRTSCTDPIPTCKNVCSKVLTCGPEDKPHRCVELCHTGPCPLCPSNSSITCRCKTLKKKIPCKEFLLYSAENPYLCERRCKKLKTCQNHRCRAVCCVEEEHVCMQICGKKLNCGNHKCDRLCHVGHCPRCLQASFEEQYCLCGHTVREPPIPCGAPLPTCDQPCSRQHPCDHPPMHNCHAEPECPPCTVLTQKPCYGAHEIRTNIPCFLNDVSCGRPCDKQLQCNVHRCKRICHAGQCLANNTCQQPCTKRRSGEACDHICGLQCHGDTPCPKSYAFMPDKFWTFLSNSCSTKVAVSCSCLRKSSEMRCSDVEKAYQKSLSLKAVEDIHSNPSEEKRLLKRSASTDRYRCLPCDAECHRVLRNKKVAEILNISERVAAASLPTYTFFLKSKLKTSYGEILRIESRLIELVHDLDAHPNKTSINHSFPPMHSEIRRIVHEYSTHFGIETVSYGEEPRRNVIATAKRNVSSIPALLLTSMGRTLAAPISVSNSLVIVPQKTLSSTSKDFSWSTENRMQQLQSAGKVLKRSSKEPFISQK